MQQEGEAVFLAYEFSLTDKQGSQRGCGEHFPSQEQQTTSSGV
jgi:hypothetical protein